MPNIMAKRGALDNIITYEHICDTIADMDNIPQNEITLGSTCTVIKGENDSIEIYMANSNKEWNRVNLATSSGATPGEESDIDMSAVDAYVADFGGNLTIRKGYIVGTYAGYDQITGETIYSIEGYMLGQG